MSSPTGSPTGTVVMWAGAAASPPFGWLVCDGSLVSQSQFSELYAIVGNNFGSNPPPGSFYLPDLRGRFVRGQDDSTGRDPDSASRVDMQNSALTVGDQVGSVQLHALQTHQHSYYHFPDGSGDIASGTYWTVSSDTTGNPENCNTSSETRPINAYLVFLIKT